MSPAPRPSLSRGDCRCCDRPRQHLHQHLHPRSDAPHGRPPRPLALLLLGALGLATASARAQAPGPAADAPVVTPAAPAAPVTPAQAAAAAVDPVSDRGFSYFLGLGRQHVRYAEHTADGAIRSAVTTSSPLLVTGALFAVNERLLFSMDSETTFAPNRATETWRAANVSIGGTTVADAEVQRNQYELSTSHLQLLGQYRVQGPWFATGGLGLRTLSFKRHGFALASSQPILLPGASSALTVPTDSTVQETSSEVVALIGAALESERVRGVDEHYGARLGLGVPLWRRVENTQSPNVLFQGAGGLDLSLEGRYSRAVLPHVHAGLWGKFTRALRPALSEGRYEVPRSTMDNLSWGVELLWKL